MQWLQPGRAERQALIGEAPGEVGPVQAGQGRQPFPTRQVAQRAQDGLRTAGTEAGDRLVGQQHRQALAQRPGNDDALPLAARPGVGPALPKPDAAGTPRPAVARDASCLRG